MNDREALARLVPWCEQFSPSVGVDPLEPPECLLFDVTGLGRLFHGEEALAERVGLEFGRRGFSTRIALADTLGAAWALAHHPICNLQSPGSPLVAPPGQTSAALAPLPIEALRLSPGCVQTLRELGLLRVEQLLAFSRDSLAARFSPELLLRLDQATGIVTEMIGACHPLPAVEAEWSFEHPTDRQDLIEQALQRQLEQVARQLSPRRQGVQELICHLRGETGKTSEIIVGLYCPSAEPRRLAELVALQWEAAHRRLAEPIAALRVSVTAAAPLEHRQQELFDDASRRCDPRQTALLIDQLSSRLGRGSVVRPKLLAEAQPELAWRYEALVGGSKRRPYASSSKKRAGRRPTSSSANATSWNWPLSRPLSLAVRPLPVEVTSVAPHGPPLLFTLSGQRHRVERSWGPERIQTGWWRGRSVRRDYYRVETADGRWFWLFRQLTDGRWYFHGTFD